MIFRIPSATVLADSASAPGQPARLQSNGRVLQRHNLKVSMAFDFFFQFDHRLPVLYCNLLEFRQLAPGSREGHESVEASGRMQGSPWPDDFCPIQSIR